MKKQQSTVAESGRKAALQTESRSGRSLAASKARRRNVTGEAARSEHSHRETRHGTPPARLVAAAAPEAVGGRAVEGHDALPATQMIVLPAGYCPSTEEEYMSPMQLAYFRRKLKVWREALIADSQQTVENLRREARDVSDEVERAAREAQNALELRTRDRYRKLISKIEKALRKIEQGRYGYCEETGEPIGLERLEARPIAALSLDAQERREHLEKQQAF